MHMTFDPKILVYNIEVESISWSSPEPSFYKYPHDIYMNDVPSVLPIQGGDQSLPVSSKRSGVLPPICSLHRNVWAQKMTTVKPPNKGHFGNIINSSFCPL